MDKKETRKTERRRFQCSTHLVPKERSIWCKDEIQTEKQMERRRFQCSDQLVPKKEIHLKKNRMRWFRWGKGYWFFKPTSKPDVDTGGEVKQTSRPKNEYAYNHQWGDFIWGCTYWFSKPASGSKGCGSLRQTNWFLLRSMRWGSHFCVFKKALLNKPQRWFKRGKTDRYWYETKLFREVLKWGFDFWFSKPVPGESCGTRKRMNIGKNFEVSRMRIKLLLLW